MNNSVNNMTKCHQVYEICNFDGNDYAYFVIIS